MQKCQPPFSSGEKRAFARTAKTFDEGQIIMKCMTIHKVVVCEKITEYKL